MWCSPIWDKPHALWHHHLFSQADRQTDRQTDVHSSVHWFSALVPPTRVWIRVSGPLKSLQDPRRPCQRPRFINVSYEITPCWNPWVPSTRKVHVEKPATRSIRGSGKCHTVQWKASTVTAGFLLKKAGCVISVISHVLCPWWSPDTAATQ